MTQRRHGPAQVEIDQTGPGEFYAKARHGPASAPAYLGPFPSYRHARDAAKAAIFGGKRPGPLPPKVHVVR